MKIKKIIGVLVLFINLSCSCHKEKITYFDSGEVMQISHYCEGKLNGKFIEYYSNGQIKAEGNQGKLILFLKRK